MEWFTLGASRRFSFGYIGAIRYIQTAMAKRLVDIDETALRAAQQKLGAATIKETVNRALRLASGEHQLAVKKRLDALASAELAPREDAWR
jgi:Arc/MetJ family transcription regulator